MTSRERELDQLFLVASRYLSQAKRISRSHPAVLTRTIREVTDKHVLGQLGPDELLLAHLGSCAIRLSTICEKEKAKFPPPYRNAFYNRGSRKPGQSQSWITAQITGRLEQHVHFLLRDNVAHEENVTTDMAGDRSHILMPLTIGVTLSALDACRNAIRLCLTSGFRRRRVNRPRPI
jgi:hypothetical protein